MHSFTPILNRYSQKTRLDSKGGINVSVGQLPLRIRKSNKRHTRKMNHRKCKVCGKNHNRTKHYRKGGGLIMGG